MRFWNLDLRRMTMALWKQGIKVDAYGFTIGKNIMVNVAIAKPKKHVEKRHRIKGPYHDPEEVE